MAPREELATVLALAAPWRGLPAEREELATVAALGAPWRELPAEAAVALVAERQLGLVKWAQLIACGLSPSAIGRWVASGRLHRLHKGVYALGHRALPPLARELAAIFAVGAGAVLSHRSAAELWDIPLTESFGAVEVSFERTGPRSRPGITVHRTRALGQDDATTRWGLPLTTPARTLLDLGDAVGQAALDRIVRAALDQRIVTSERLRALAEEHPRRRAARRLTSALGEVDGTTMTRSEAERRMLTLLARARLPRPRVNAFVEGCEVDLLWEDERLVVEIDGFAFHSSRSAFERDRDRDARLQLAGYRVLRFTWRQLEREPEAVVARVAAALYAP